VTSYDGTASLHDKVKHAAQVQVPIRVSVANSKQSTSSDKAQNYRKSQLRGAERITISYFVCPLSSSGPRQDSDQALLQWLSACQDATAIQMLCQQGKAKQSAANKEKGDCGTVIAA